MLGNQGSGHVNNRRISKLRQSLLESQRISIYDQRGDLHRKRPLPLRWNGLKRWAGWFLYACLGWRFLCPSYPFSWLWLGPLRRDFHGSPLYRRVLWPGRYCFPQWSLTLFLWQGYLRCQPRALTLWLYHRGCTGLRGRRGRESPTCGTRRGRGWCNLSKITGVQVRSTQKQYPHHTDDRQPLRLRAEPFRGTGAPLWGGGSAWQKIILFHRLFLKNVGPSIRIIATSTIPCQTFSLPPVTVSPLLPGG